MKNRPKLDKASIAALISAILILGFIIFYLMISK
jgi:hypothetical protein